MAKKKSAQAAPDDEMQAEYDLSNRKGARGRYYATVQQGYTVRIHEDDGTTTVRHCKMEKAPFCSTPMCASPSSTPRP